MCYFLIIGFCINYVVKYWIEGDLNFRWGWGFYFVKCLDDLWVFGFGIVFCLKGFNID